MVSKDLNSKEKLWNENESPLYNHLFQSFDYWFYRIYWLFLGTKVFAFTILDFTFSNLYIGISKITLYLSKKDVPFLLSSLYTHKSTECHLPIKLFWFPSFFLFFLKRFIYLFNVYGYTVAVFRYTRKGIGSHYRWLWAAMWLLGIELRTSGRTLSALAWWAIFPAPLFFFF